MPRTLPGLALSARALWTGVPPAKAPLRRVLPTWALLLAALLAASPVPATPNPPAPSPALPARLPVETFQLDNGMTFLLVQRPQMVTVVAGWVAHVGSVNEGPGTTGLTHLLEHMLFKGTETVGARDWPREQASLAEQDRLQEEIRRAYRRQRARHRAGEIDDPYAPEARPPALVELEERFAAEVEGHRALVVPGELGRIYSRAGAVGLNALTLQDMTLFFVTVPAPKVELWFWMESDRLLHPVFRELYTERSVVHEERRQRTESTPTGPVDEQLKAMFWQPHPYAHPVLGWPSDLAVLHRAQAAEHFATYYRPENLTAALVGNFDPGEVEELARRYFGRLARGEAPVPDVTTLVPRQRAEKRMLAHCECRPQVEVLYHTVPFGHPDAYALEVLAGLLNGRTGRLYRSLVLEQEVAYSAQALQSAMRWAGLFSFSAEAKGGSTPEDLLAAWDRELAALTARPPTDGELTRVRNQITADAYRRLEEPSALLLQLLLYDGFGDWRHLNRWAAGALAVTGEDVQRVVRRYFRPENRTVGMYERRAGEETAARRGR